MNVFEDSKIWPLYCLKIWNGVDTAKSPLQCQLHHRIQLLVRLLIIYPVIKSKCEFLNLYNSGCIRHKKTCKVSLDCKLIDVFGIVSLSRSILERIWNVRQGKSWWRQSTAHLWNFSILITARRTSPLREAATPSTTALRAAIVVGFCLHTSALANPRK